MQRFTVTVSGTDDADGEYPNIEATRPDVAVSKVLRTISSTPIDKGTGNAYKAPIKMDKGQQVIITVWRWS